MGVCWGSPPFLGQAQGARVGEQGCPGGGDAARVTHRKCDAHKPVPRFPPHLSNGQRQQRQRERLRFGGRSNSCAPAGRVRAGDGGAVGCRARWDGCR